MTEARPPRRQPVTVTVGAPANKPPTVSIIAPAPSASYTAPASVSITATALMRTGPIAKVDFYANGQLTGLRYHEPLQLQLDQCRGGNLQPQRDRDRQRRRDGDVAAGHRDRCRTRQQAADRLDHGTVVRAPATPRPASVSITATAADSDGSVTRVDFYANGQPVGLRHIDPVQLQLERCGCRELQPDRGGN